MEIRPANLIDLSSLWRLESVCFGNDAWSVFDLIAVLSWQDVIRLKTVESGEMIGFIAGECGRSSGVGWIATLAVHPRYQRRGIGWELLRACETQIGLPMMKLTVKVSNQGAIALYERAGYRTTDIWRDYYSDGEDGLVMTKNL
jgi:ribosomal-protein-alanine N-acetyltransferase